MYQIRKCERYTSYRTSEVAKLDPNKFKSISLPFKGESEEEFLHYIRDNEFDQSELDEETQSELENLYDPDWTEYYNSSFNFADDWYESGNPDSEFRKNGEFDSKFTTKEEE